jgi:hypothetical protein
MLENLEKIKKQLSELAGVINLFKSEAVQLKIVEFILGDVTEPEEEIAGGGTPRRHKITRRKKFIQKEGSGIKPPLPHKKKGSGGTGSVANLTQLWNGDFFKQPRTIKDIIDHCKQKLARTFKANDFSGALARMTREGKLTRNKNKGKQYEYKKP